MSDEPTTPTRYRILGVNKETQNDVDIEIEAASEANAKVKAELQGIIVTSVSRMPRPQSPQLQEMIAKMSRPRPPQPKLPPGEISPRTGGLIILACIVIGIGIVATYIHYEGPEPSTHAPPSQTNSQSAAAQALQAFRDEGKRVGGPYPDYVEQTIIIQRQAGWYAADQVLDYKTPRELRDAYQRWKAAAR